MELIYKGDTNALRVMARAFYEQNRIGKVKMMLAVGAADELDDARRELSFSRGATQKKSVRDFMENLIANDIIEGKAYSERIAIEDGGDNSYIGLCVDIDDYNRVKPVIRGVRLFRHSNSADKLINTWEFELGGVCHSYFDNPGIPLQYSSYGKTADEAETEATTYFDALRKRIQKTTSEYKIRMAETAEEERQKLLARLSELDSNTKSRETEATK